MLGTTMQLNVSFLQDLLTSIAEQGRSYLPTALIGGRRIAIEDLVKALLSGRGEASGVAIAREIVDRYAKLKEDERTAFFRFLSAHVQPDREGLARAATSYLAAPGPESMHALQKACESPCQEFFRRLNRAPGATAEIVGMRRDLLARLKANPDLVNVDRDLRHLLSSWFNRGFLVLRRIDWQTPAVILDKIIQYEAVHEIRGWEDLKRRLDPHDRRCYAFFHPSLVDEPLIFVEVALMRDTPAAIGQVLEEQPKRGEEPAHQTTAVFYSISNCQEGLRGISFGNFLIKQVVEDLVKERPSLKTFVTLSPVPGFARWLEKLTPREREAVFVASDAEALARLTEPNWSQRKAASEQVKAALMPAAAHYFLRAKAADGMPVDPVARFHLGNGARLERINWHGDVSPKGLREGHGLMVNYRYDLGEIETNHEAFENAGIVAAAKAVRTLLRPLPAPPRPDPVKRLAPPAPSR
jgi:malonyl-CoA decarboxylase